MQTFYYILKCAILHSSTNNLLTYNNVYMYTHTQLDKPVVAQGNVEHWLGALLKEALHSVHVVIRNASIAVEDPSFDMVDFLDVQPAQVTK